MAKAQTALVWLILMAGWIATSPTIYAIRAFLDL